MLKVDWKLVEAKAQELYPRYAQGLTYSQLETELTQQGFDKDHINAINEALVKRHQDVKGKKLNWPLIAVSIIISILFVLGVSFLFAKADVLLVVGGGVLIFTAIRIVVRRNAHNKGIGSRWK